MPEFPDFYCKEDLENCPFRIYDLEKNIIICNYFETYWSTASNYGHERAKQLINRACKDIKTYELHQRQTAEHHTKKTLEMLQTVKIGDILFWASRNEDVRLIEMPSEIDILVRCKCQRRNNEIVRIPAYLLNTISKRNFSGEYNCRTNKDKAQRLKYQAKLYGFRTEIEKRGEDYILRLYGDSREEVDDFIALYITQKLYIRPYY